MRIGKYLFAIKIPPLSQRGGRGRFNYSNLSKINLPNLFTKEGLFYDVAFSGFIGNIFERVKNGERLWSIKLPLFRKEGVGGRFNYSNLSQINSPNPSLQKNFLYVDFIRNIFKAS